MDNIKKNKTTIRINNISYITMIVMSLINIAIILLYDDPSENQVIIGFLILLTSVMLMLRVKKAKTLFFLISIITYINASVAIIDCFYGGEMLSAYQWALRHSEFNQTYAKSILLNTTLISLIITPRMIRRATETNNIIIEQKNNLIIAYAGIAYIIFALIFGFERTNSIEYISNAKPLYEYAILVFLFVWHYSKNNKTVNLILFVCALIYIVQGLYYGDRSSALVLMVLIFMLFYNKISVLRMMLLAVAGIMFANVVAIFRDYSTIGLSGMVNMLLNRGALLFFSDTASYSYYAGITVVASRLALPESPLYYLYKFIIAIFLGGSSHLSEGADITVLVRQVYYNGGGGLYPSYFYFWGQYLGVIIGAIILGFILYKVFSKKTPYYLLLQYYLTIMCFRWYLYTPMTFFRSTIFIFSLLYALCYLFDKITNKKSPILIANRN